MRWITPGTDKLPGCGGRALADKLHTAGRQAACRYVDEEGTLDTNLADMTLSSLVTQVQTTLASVQDLLRQQQQKVQELTHELATAKVLDFGPLGPQAKVCSI